MLSLPESSSAPAGNQDSLPPPRVTLLEYNASPDFHQSGSRLRGKLGEMFRGVVELSIKPFFAEQGKGRLSEDEDADKKDGKKEMEVGEEAYGWKLFGKGQVRGPGA